MMVAFTRIANVNNNSRDIRWIISSFIEFGLEVLSKLFSRRMMDIEKIIDCSKKAALEIFFLL